MAYLYKRGGVWWIQIYRGNGLPRIRQRLGRDEPAARAILAAADEARDAESSGAVFADVFARLAEAARSDETDLADLAQDFLSARAGTVCASSLESYRLRLGRFVEAFRRRRWRGLTLGQVTEWLRSQPGQAGTIRVLRAAGRYWHQERLWVDNALTRLRGGATKHRTERLSDAELARCELRLAGTPLLGPFLAGAYAGMRAGETCHARREFVNRDGGFLVVKPYTLDGTAWSTKNARTRRVPLHPKLLAVIGPGGVGWLFPTASGGRWDRHNLYREMKRATRYGLHVLRHTFVSRLLEAGVGASVVRDLAGHSSIAVTDGYAHVENSALEEAILRL